MKLTILIATVTFAACFPTVARAGDREEKPTPCPYTCKNEDERKFICGQLPGYNEYGTAECRGGCWRMWAFCRPGGCMNNICVSGHRALFEDDVHG